MRSLSSVICLLAAAVISTLTLSGGVKQPTERDIAQWKTYVTVFYLDWKRDFDKAVQKPL